ncbi:uncharacterized protein LOC101240538 isoform X1 [Hydra vulgaris]|uniref:uncharacterized protein LOC101240538 isoform X1 n=1 Tax=Hydra vulgaris TaxID=6087 RepID=UPI001F5EE603|nr:uncharacterized protein LOC101240538 [Hydra vulgaris]
MRIYYVQKRLTMNFEIKLLQFLLFLFVHHLFCYGKQYTAYFNENDLQGKIVFIQANEGENVTVQVNFNVDVSNFNWIIVNKPLYYGLSICQDMQPQNGRVLNVVNNNNSYSFVSPITLYGNNSIYGSTLILGNNIVNQSVACGTILSDNDIYSFVQISSSVVAGSIHFLQSNDLTMIYASLGASDGTLISVQYDWFISPFSVCSNLNVRIKDLTGMFGYLSSETFFWQLTSNISASDIVGMTLNIMDKSGIIISCSKIKQNGPLKSQAIFPSTASTTSGNFVFTQLSPFHPTFVEITLHGLDSQLNGYHIHMFPISDNNNKCSQSSIGGHFNPYQVNASTSPQPGKGSYEKYEAGNLSGKYGTLLGKNNFSLQIVDVSIQLYGFNTIIGRSVVLHRTNGSHYICANIEPDGSKMISLLVNYTANSKSILDGQVLLLQYIQANNVLTPTLIIVNVNYRNDSKITLNHNFHVHELAIGDDTSVCSSVLGHYNPAKVNINQPAYVKQCSKENPYRCELGDTSSKVGTYDIGSGKAFYADVDAPLFGPHSISGRSITFHHTNKTAPRLACANLGDNPQRFIVYLNQNNIRGKVLFEQNGANDKVLQYFEFEDSLITEKFSYAFGTNPNEERNCTLANIDNTMSITGLSPTSISLIDSFTLFGSNSIYGKTLVLSTSNGQPLACGTVLSQNDLYSFVYISNIYISGTVHFLQAQDVTLVFASIINSGSTPQEFDWYISKNQFSNCSNLRERNENLAETFGYLNSGKSFTQIHTNLSLNGGNTINNRGLVILDKSNNILGCGKIQNNGPLKSSAIFNSATHQGVNGSFSFTQNSPFHPTNVVISLTGLGKNAKGYHVHMFPISDLSDQCSSQSVGLHFNPNKVKATTSPTPGQGTYDKYQAGDLGGKYGFLTDKTDFDLQIIDNSLQLYGLNTIIGRSIVIHSNNIMSLPFVCADIKPIDGVALSLIANFTDNPNSDLNGTITVRQFNQSNGVLTPSVMVLDLAYKNSSVEPNDLNFHVLESLVGYDQRNCSGKYYNPAGVSLKQPDYCKASPYGCQIGDISMKVGTYSLGSKEFYSDVNMPLFGTTSILNHSISLEDPNKSPPGLACADLVPTGDRVANFSLRLKLSINEKNTLYTILIQSLNLNADSLWKFAYINASIVDSACTQFTIYLIDDSVLKTDSQKYNDQINEAKKGSDLMPLLKCDNDLCDIDEHCGSNAVCNNHNCECTYGYERINFNCEKKRNRSLFIAGIVVPLAFLFVALSAVLLVWCIRKHRSKKIVVNAYDNL